LARDIRGDGVEDLAVAGVATNLCVEAAVRSGFDLDFRMFPVMDALGAHREDLHVGALRSMAFGFACVSDSERIIKSLGSLLPEKAAAKF
jgi:nicotinamidase-related amidase